MPLKSSNINEYSLTALSAQLDDDFWFEELSLENPGFEDGLDGWEKSIADGVVIQRSTEEKYSGQASCSIKVGQNVKPGFYRVCQFFPLLPGKFIASAFLKTGVIKDGVGAYMAVEYLDRTKRVGHKQTRGYANSMDWTKIELCDIPPPEAERVLVSLILAGNGEAWFDDVSVKTYVADSGQIGYMSQASVAGKTGQRHHPYRLQPKRAFWNRTIQDVYPLDIGEWYRKKFDLSHLRIATAGSCFAQHIGRKLWEKKFNYIDMEPAPGFLKKTHWADFGYGMYSARYGNVYTSRQLLQLVQRAMGEFTPAETAWEKNGGYVDPFRPTIEPEPLSSADEVETFRRHHLTAVAELFEKTDVFVFTLGLTEAWIAIQDGAVFPVAPGTAGGEYDPLNYQLINLSYFEVCQDLEAFFKRVRCINPQMKFMLTVSPVPLMATATSQQVMVATTYSKSVLRAAAGYLANKYAYVDYFPSYEIISSHVMRGQFYNPDMRTVSQFGVDHVMQQFFKEHRPPIAPATKPQEWKNSAAEDRERLVCDEEILAVFG
ncbi:MAG: GSCFA domain-containing protein [Gammaproteobacteria bacterium]